MASSYLPLLIGSIPFIVPGFCKAEAGLAEKYRGRSAPRVAGISRKGAGYGSKRRLGLAERADNGLSFFGIKSKTAFAESKILYEVRKKIKNSEVDGLAYPFLDGKIRVQGAETSCET